MIFIQRTRRKAALKQVAARIGAFVNMQRVAPVRFADGASQAVRRRRHDQQVNMIGHQTIADYLHAAALGLRAHQIQLEPSIIIIKKHRLRTHTALRHMMQITRQNDA